MAKVKDIITINISDTKFILPKSFILERARKSKLAEDIFFHGDVLYYYRDPSSFSRIYNYLCGYDSDYLGQTHKEILIILLADCDFYKLPELKTKILKYVTVNEEYVSHIDITTLRTLIYHMYDVIQDLYPEATCAINYAKLNLDDDKTLTYILQLLYRTPKYEFHNCDTETQFNIFIKFLTRFGTVSIINDLADMIRKNYGNVSADIFEKALHEFVEVKTTSTSIWSNLLSNIFSYDTLINFGNALYKSNVFSMTDVKDKQLKDTQLVDKLQKLKDKLLKDKLLHPVPSDKDNTLNIIENTLNFINDKKNDRNNDTNLDDATIHANFDHNTNFQKILNDIANISKDIDDIKNIMKYAINHNNIDVTKDVKNIYKQLNLSDSFIGNVVDNSSSDLPELVSDSQSSSDEYDKISDTEYL